MCKLEQGIYYWLGYESHFIPFYSITSWAPKTKQVLKNWGWTFNRLKV